MKNSSAAFLRLFLCCVVTLSIAFHAKAQETSERIREALEYKSAAKLYGEPIRRISLVKEFYKDREYAPGWDARATDEITSSIEKSYEHGFFPYDYHVNALKEAREANDAHAVEILATDAFFLLAGHLANGRTNVNALVDSWTAAKDSINYVDYLRDALRSGDIADSLKSLAPFSPEYAAFAQELAKYKMFDTENFPDKVKAGEILRLGMQTPRVAKVRARLIAFGALAEADELPAKQDDIPKKRQQEELDLQAQIVKEETFDETLFDAVKSFQKSVNLIDDGVVGKKTLEEINRNPDERATTVKVNMERLRWLPKDLGDKYIQVNIADYKLKTVEFGKIVRYHDVVVGRDYRQTPVFSADMHYIVLNPWWIAPDKLAREDKLPVFQKNPDKAYELGFEVTDKQGNKVNLASIDWNRVNQENFPYRLHQKPGDLNALGKVKFIFPNRYNVYLHDTPSKKLFDRKRRDFSSGCVRVKNPFDLAEWVLEDNNWDRDRIEKAVKSGRETRVNLKRRIPVHLLYFTNILDEDGRVRFLDDLYERDAAVARALSASL